MLVVGLWNAPEVIGRRALAPGPADGLPLQQVVGHQVAVFITRGPIEVDRLLRHAAYEDTGQQLPFVLGQEELRLVERHKDLPRAPVIIKGMNTEVVTYTRGLQ